VEIFGNINRKQAGTLLSRL